MLGITSKNVRSIVGRYCRLYEMSEEQNKDLSKMITNTTKQYKELSPQLLNKVIATETQ
jgi:galactose-1-phosphate uridylyltransferase